MELHCLFTFQARYPLAWLIITSKAEGSHSNTSLYCTHHGSIGMFVWLRLQMFSRHAFESAFEPCFEFRSFSEWNCRATFSCGCLSLPCWTLLTAAVRQVILHLVTCASGLHSHMQGFAYSQPLQHETLFEGRNVHSSLTTTSCNSSGFAHLWTLFWSVMAIAHHWIISSCHCAIVLLISQHAFVPINDDSGWNHLIDCDAKSCIVTAFS